VRLLLALARLLLLALARLLLLVRLLLQDWSCD
jgi:hypothetical protein